MLKNKEPYEIRNVDDSVPRYLKRRPEIRTAFDRALESIKACPFSFQDRVHVAHLTIPYKCDYRYTLKKGKRGARLKYKIDQEDRAIDIYYLGPRGAAY